MIVQTPDWVKHAVFYQIFPDRFARSANTNHPRGITLKPWGTPPEEQGFQGGDLRGIADKLEYLSSLGINALYLNPIFSSASNHRYHAFDYYQVDPLLGGNDALRELLDKAHAMNMRVVLDGVFNHASRGFWPFHHILETGLDSPYLDWFVVKDWPLRPYSSGKDKPLNYGAWWNLPALPEFNTDNPGVRDYIFDVARYWIDFGIDGWRLDVPADIDDDSFWREFRRVVKDANPEAYICGEIWHEAQRWLAGDQFDSVMNYIFTWNALSFFGADTLRTDWSHSDIHLDPIDGEKMRHNIDHMHDLYDWEINYVQLNLLDSHDMPRALYLMGEDKSGLRLSVLFQMTMPGAPCIYYGDEVGLSAGGDPYCREAFPWHDESSWDHNLLAFYREAAALRHNHPVLRTGTFEFISGEGKLIAFQRVLDDQEALVIFNADHEQAQLQIPADLIQSDSFRQVWPLNGKKRFQTHDSVLNLTVPARDALILISA
ncbi:MAG: glycoside hydrolase family 13 protein [Chloroflexota bacterium]